VSRWRYSLGGASWCWNMTAVRQAVRAFSWSVMPSLRKERFQASRLETSGTLSESTLTWQTTPAGSSARAEAARAARRRKSERCGMIDLRGSQLAGWGFCYGTPVSEQAGKRHPVAIAAGNDYTVQVEVRWRTASPSQPRRAPHERHQPRLLHVP